MYILPNVSLHLIVVIMVVFSSSSSDVLAQEHESSRPVPRSNLSVLQNALQQIASEMLDGAHLTAGDSVSIRVPSQEDAWMAEQAIVTTVKSRGLTAYSPNDITLKPHYVFDIRAVSLQVRYTRMFTDPRYSSKCIEREIIAEISGQLENSTSKEILFGGTSSRRTLDTVAVDDIGIIEQAGITVTHAELPSENIIDRIIEPFVIIGATGVAIYLLFHVRS